MSSGPAIILVRPQLSENIGTAARAMLNNGLTDLRLVAPKPDWLSDRAIAAASGADRVVLGAKVFDTTAEAVADLNRVWATTARNRFMVKPVDTPRTAAAAMLDLTAQGVKFGVLFGPERTGLENDDIVQADTVVTVPLNPDYSSLNLAQCVLLIAYEWYQAQGPELPERHMTKGAADIATKEKLEGFFQHLERELDECGFLRIADKRPVMVRNIRNLFQRAHLTGQEVQTLHGIVHELVTYRHRKGQGTT
ncbi:putative tRNA (Cytidine/uridine-2'-O-)-methyltransferase [Magnetospirillum sp. LM-5]|uniref:RNA methyltransferase n=1 Tax=Magnetospirillum sp. LM-5 TaxID=2681466 RepID=UPI00137FED83|nr:RNA methyltransferase [Magnetospirillum sp. LM-5]CAA7625965.1 putative tRNA (Cytidine/uridine-2'-O-)-methyltransferase [Magnetospirillum sp. LM-5]